MTATLTEPVIRTDNTIRGVEPLYSVKQVADHLSLSTDRIYYLVAIGAIRHIPIGRAKRIPDTALREFLTRGITLDDELAAG